MHLFYYLCNIVHLLDVNSEIGVHLRTDLDYLICLRHLIRLIAVTNCIFFLKKDLFSSMPAQHFLPSNISTMIFVQTNDEIFALYNSSYLTTSIRGIAWILFRGGRYPYKKLQKNDSEELYFPLLLNTPRVYAPVLSKKKFTYIYYLALLTNIFFIFTLYNLLHVTYIRW